MFGAYYEEFLTEEQIKLVNGITDELGLKNCLDIEWILGDGWDDLQTKKMRFAYYKDGTKKFTFMEKPVRVILDIYGLKKGQKNMEIKMGRYFAPDEKYKVPVNARYIARMIRTKWNYLNGIRDNSEMVKERKQEEAK